MASPCAYPSYTLSEWEQIASPMPPSVIYAGIWD
jgi:hypothetical protein